MNWLRMIANELGERFTDNRSLATGLIAVMFGVYGAHKFLLGYKKEGLIMLATTLTGVLLAIVGMFLQWDWLFFTGFFICVAVEVVSIVEGLIYFSKKEWEFYGTYVMNRRGWFWQ